jgi:hypothetical protein
LKEAIVLIDIPKNGKVIVVGDLHGIKIFKFLGQLLDFFTIYSKFGIIIYNKGKPNEKLYYLFNGDFVGIY